MLYSNNLNNETKMEQYYIIMKQIMEQYYIIMKLYYIIMKQ